MSGPKVTFYDVTPEARWPMIAQLAEAAVKRGRRLLIHCGDVHVGQELDTYLWTFPEDSFLPHEFRRSGETGLDPKVPVVIMAGEHREVNADILVQEAATSLDFASNFKAVIDFVDHRTPALLSASRERFRAWRERDLSPSYRRS